MTIPSLRPTILFTIVVSTIGATQLFGEPLLFGGRHQRRPGGAEHQYQTLGLYLYEQGWINGHLGRAAAVAWAMFLHPADHRRDQRRHRPRRRKSAA